MEEKLKILYDDIDYLIIQVEETQEIIAKITQYNSEIIDGYILRIKPISKEKDKTEVQSSCNKKVNQ